MLKDIKIFKEELERNSAIYKMVEYYRPKEDDNIIERLPSSHQFVDKLKEQ